MCADPLRLGEDLAALERGGIDSLHCDVMDGHFVPNLAMSIEVIARVRAATVTPIDVHLMVEEPERWVEPLAAARVDRVSVHLEATRAPIRLLGRIRAAGMSPGIALCPITPAASLVTLLDELDHVLVMTVEPGFAGQRFLPGMLDKIDEIRRLALARDRSIAIAVDGNIDAERGARCLRAGADTLVVGTSGIFAPGADLGHRTVAFRRALQQAVGCGV
jgi:ribulose-phosphate 3-epimerase